MAEYRPATSLEYLRILIKADVVLDNQPISVAFMAANVTPDDDDMHEAEWVGDPGEERTAQLLLGPGGDVELVAGDYTVWYKLTDSPEIPWRPVDRLKVT